jgi:gamma-glutamyltranspeptidase/glutathione hydrolase
MNIRLYKVSVFFLVFSVLGSPKGYTQIDREAGSMFQTRPKVIGQRGMVATSQPLATQVGLQILKNGGNAIDAAIAANATMGFSSLRSSAAQCPDGSGEAPASSGY